MDAIEAKLRDMGHAIPELTPPVLIIGTLAPGLGPKDVEKTISWRLEKYVSATPGVDHVESLSRNNFSVVSMRPVVFRNSSRVGSSVRSWL